MMTPWDRIHIEAQSVAVLIMANFLTFFLLHQGLVWTYGDKFWFVLLVSPLGFYAGLRAQHWYRDKAIRGYYRKLGHG